MKASLKKRARGARDESETWRWGFVWVTGALVLSYLIQAIFWDVRPGNWAGMAYGTGATFFLLGAGLWGWRRRAMSLASRYRLGSARRWLLFHLYGGGLFGILVLMHSGFRLPNGILTWWLFVLSLWTVISGLVGRALQVWIPRVLSSGLAVEVNYERIPELVREIHRRAGELVEERPEPFRALFRRSLSPALAEPRWRPLYFLDITGGVRSQLKELNFLRQRLPDEEDTVDALEGLVRTKLEIDAHYTLQRVLRAWLFAHVPLSLVLTALVVLHIFMVFYY